MNEMANSQGAALISKDETIKTSPAFIGYLILKEIKRIKKDKISIYDIGSILKKQGIIHGSQFVLAMSFLYSTGIIDFKEPYIYRVANND